MRRITISDIHGCRKTFEALLDKVQLTQKDELYLLGDYIDRGPDSKAVIDYIWQLQRDGYTVHCLRGNHEQAMIDSRNDREKYSSWLYWGGRQTLQSFRTHSLDLIPSGYWHFLENLDYFFEVDNYLLVHAGLNFDLPNPFNGQHSMLWIREWYPQINYEWLGDRIIVHGHTPVSKQNIQSALVQLEETQVIDIDNGCFAINAKGKGSLCAFDLTNKQLYFQENLDDMTVYFQ